VALKPRDNGGKKALVHFNGERKAGAMTDFLVSHMPERVVRVSTATHGAWMKKNPAVPKALLFSEKKTSAPLVKSLSVKYKVAESPCCGGRVARL
jgi:protein disulfide-isomerase A6